MADGRHDSIYQTPISEKFVGNTEVESPVECQRVALVDGKGLAPGGCRLPAALNPRGNGNIHNPSNTDKLVRG